jgi:hypothetical protein
MYSFLFLLMLVAIGLGFLFNEKGQPQRTIHVHS